MFSTLAFISFDFIVSACATSSNFIRLTANRQLLKKIGINIDTIAETGNAVALSELSLKYLAPLKVRLFFFYDLKKVANGHYFETKIIDKSVYNVILIAYFFMLFFSKQIGDRFTLRVRISNTSAARIYFEDLIFKIPNEEVTCIWPYLIIFFHI